MPNQPAADGRATRTSCVFGSPRAYSSQWWTGRAATGPTTTPHDYRAGGECDAERLWIRVTALLPHTAAKLLDSRQIRQPGIHDDHLPNPGPWSRHVGDIRQRRGETQAWRFGAARAVWRAAGGNGATLRIDDEHASSGRRQLKPRRAQARSGVLSALRHLGRVTSKRPARGLGQMSPSQTGVHRCHVRNPPAGKLSPGATRSFCSCGLGGRWPPRRGPE